MPQSRGVCGIVQAQVNELVGQDIPHLSRRKIGGHVDARLAIPDEKITTSRAGFDISGSGYFLEFAPIAGRVNIKAFEGF